MGWIEKQDIVDEASRVAFIERVRVADWKSLDDLSEMMKHVSVALLEFGISEDVAKEFRENVKVAAALVQQSVINQTDFGGPIGQIMHADNVQIAMLPPPKIPQYINDEPRYDVVAMREIAALDDEEPVESPIQKAELLGSTEGSAG